MNMSTNPFVFAGTILAISIISACTLASDNNELAGDLESQKKAYGELAWPKGLELNLPIDAPCVAVHGAYGDTWHSGKASPGRYNDHFALDLSHPTTPGYPVVAPVAGEVLVVHRATDPVTEIGYTSFGNRLVIEVNYQKGTWYLFFAHLDIIDVEPGQNVEVGDYLGVVGNSGVEDSSKHLHFSVHRLIEKDRHIWRPRFLDGVPVLAYSVMPEPIAGVSGIESGLLLGRNCENESVHSRNYGIW